MRTLEAGAKDFTVYSIYGVNADTGRSKADAAVSSSTFSTILPDTVTIDAKSEMNTSDIRYQKSDGTVMSDAEQLLLRQLQQRDKEVREHEMAHVSAGGQYVTPANFSYESGPDGKQYAVGGEVGIDVSEIPDNPDATVVKMRIVERAAMAPRDPSGQDYAVASQARAKESIAFAEIQQKTAEKYQTSTESFAPYKQSTVDLLV